MKQNNIAEKQNEQISLDRLAAQRHLYTKAKRLSNLSFVVCALTPVFLSVAKVVWSDCVFMPKIIVVYSFGATLLRIWLKDVIVKLKTKAAQIQQLFDCELFGLPWDKAICGSQPKPEDVHSSIKGASYKNLKNWYDPIVSELPLTVGALVCMRTNIVYDQSLRKAYSALCNILIGFAFLVVLVCGMVNNTGLWDAFLYGMVPLLPLITWWIDQCKQHNANLTALNNIETLVESGLTQAQSHKYVDTHNFEQIQSFIFLHRKSSYLIPDFFYGMTRKWNEADAKYGAKETCEKYNLL